MTIWNWNPPDPTDRLTSLLDRATLDPFDADLNACCEAYLGIAPRDVVTLEEVEDADEIPY